jgi:hypothetical protein
MNFSFASLGKGLQGVSPKVTLNTQQGNSWVAPLGQASQIPLDRTVLRNSFPSTSIFQGKYVLTNSWAQTPFRVAMNAGDLLLRQSEPGGSNQIKGKLGTRLGGMIARIDSTHRGDGASGNQHYVYDSSVYTTYRRRLSKNKNYNDSSFGGDQHNSTQSILRAIRRF